MRTSRGRGSRLVVAVVSAVMLAIPTVGAEPIQAEPIQVEPIQAGPIQAGPAPAATHPAPAPAGSPLMPLGTVVAQRTADTSRVSAGLTSLDPAALVRAAHHGPDGRTAVRAALLQAQVMQQAGLGYVLPATPQLSQDDSGTARSGTGYVQTTGQIGVVGLAGPGSPQTVGVGDLDGDGVDDVVTVSFDAAGVTLTALRGSDGGAIWVAPQPADVVGGFLQVVGDVDGDGRQDVMDTAVESLDTSGSGGCDGEVCHDEYRESFRTTATVIDGASGTPLWVESIEGSLQQTSSSSADGSSYSYTVEQSNVGVPYYGAQDIDGQGGVDLLSTLSTTTASQSYAEEGTSPGPVTSRESRSSEASSEVRLVDGADGSIIRSLGSDGDDDGAVIVTLPVPDLDGDRIADVLATSQQDGSYQRECTMLLVEVSCEESGTPASGVVAVLGGADLAAQWEVEGLGPFLVALAPADLTDDDAVDVVISQFPLDGDPDAPRLLALDGRTGTELWTTTSESQDDEGEEANPFAGFSTPTVLGATPLQDDDGIDLLALEPVIEFDGDTGQIDVRAALLRLDGATGETLLRTEPDFDEADDESVLGVSGQLVHADDDASADVLVQAVVYSEDGDPRTVAVVEDGPDGTVRSRRDMDGFSVLRVLGDLDGDGRDEASVDTSLFGVVGTGTATSGGSGAGGGVDAEAQAPVLSVVELDSDATLWSVPAPEMGIASVRPAGLLTPDDDGIDVVVDTLTWFGGTVQTRVAARDGDDGRLLWSVPEAITVRRVAGATRTATAAALSADLRDRADTVVIARADLWPDAVTGAPLAAVLNGSLLLAGGQQLGADARAEVQRLGANRAVLLGGEDAISPDVAAELAALGLAVERIGGSDRFATAAAIAQRVVAEGGDGTRVVLARGAHPDADQGWSDAVTASAFAARAGNPVLLTLPDRLPDATAAALAELGSAQALVLGGPAAVSDQVQQAVRDLGSVVLRISGFDRYATARSTAELAVEEGTLPATVWLATGMRFPDALAASAAAGTDGVLLLTPGGPDDPVDQAMAFIAANRAEIDQVVVIGGAAAIDPAVQSRLDAALR